MDPVSYMIAAGASLLGAGLLGAAMTKPGTGAALNAVGLPAWAQNCWMAFTPEAYRELVSRVVANELDLTKRLTAMQAAQWLYLDMERVRDAFVENPELSEARLDFHTISLDRYKALHAGIKHGSTSTLSEGERAFLRMFVDAANTYLKIGQRVQGSFGAPDLAPPGSENTAFDVSCADLAKITCLSEQRISEASKEILKKYVEQIEKDMQWHFTQWSVSSLVELIKKRDAMPAGLVEEEKLAAVSEVDKDRFRRDQELIYQRLVGDVHYLERAQANIDALYEQLQKLRIRRVRPLRIEKLRYA